MQIEFIRICFHNDFYNIVYLNTLNLGTNYDYFSIKIENILRMADLKIYLLLPNY